MNVLFYGSRPSTIDAKVDIYTVEFPSIEAHNEYKADNRLKILKTVEVGTIL